MTEDVAQWSIACLACMRPQVSISAQKKKERRKWSDVALGTNHVHSQQQHPFPPLPQ